MFDIGFSEMVVVGVVALIVIGPEKLPKVARTVGILLGRAQRYVDGVKSDINRQLQVDEMKQMQAQMTQQARELENSLTQNVQTIEQNVQLEVKAVEDELYRGFEPPKPTPAQPEQQALAAASPAEVPVEKISA